MAQPAPSPASVQHEPINPNRLVWFNGELVPALEARVSVFDHGLLYGDGVFEGIRAYRGKVLKMRSHLNRLVESGRAIALDVPYTIGELGEAIHRTLAANELSDAYIRLGVTRGFGTLGLDPKVCRSPSTFIITDKIALYPEQMYAEGLVIVTASTVRTHPASLSPRIKSMNYLNNIMAKIEALNAGCIEAVMLNHQGFVAECTGDNIFIVKDGVLRTPPLHAGILEGITRNLVVDLAGKAGVPVEQVDLTRHDLYIADECFLTGTAAEVIAVTTIDDRRIGNGKPGPVTQQLLGAFRAFVADAPED
jgi:branched-chain amino acid aminotransferase